MPDNYLLPVELDPEMPEFWGLPPEVPKTQLPLKPSLADNLKGALADALDPIGIWHTSDLEQPRGAAPADEKTPLGELFSGFGKSAGGLVGLTVLLAVGYLIFKNELRR